MPTFVAKIDLSLSTKLKQDLIEQGFDLTYPPYTLFSAKKPGINCTLYTTGKLTIQGKNIENFIINYLEGEILKALPYTYPETMVDLTPHMGFDESGKGDYFGPLCIAGVYADENGIKTLLHTLKVKDSKQMSDAAVLQIAQKIRLSFPYTLVVISPKRYNELYQSFQNLNHLLSWAHAEAISALFEKTQCPLALVDQFAHESVLEKAVQAKKTKLQLQQKVRGEQDPVVAAASILARAALLEAFMAMTQKLGLSIPKGASAQVIQSGKVLLQKYGKDIFSQFAKLHFSTTQKIFN